MGAPIVMVSSTVVDLPEHRQALRDACANAKYFPEMMEQLSASDQTATATSMAMVDEAEAFIGVYAFRYGHVPKRARKSITEMELDRAESRRIPVFPFVMDEAHLPPPQRETDADAARHLELLKERACARRIRMTFKSADELRRQVESALHKFTVRRQAQALSDANQTIALLNLQREELTHRLNQTQHKLKALTGQLPARRAADPDM